MSSGTECTEESLTAKGLQPAQVLVCQSLGFLSIIFVCLFDELLGLSALIFRDQSYIVDLQGFTLKMLLILCVWLLVSGTTRRTMAQAQHLAKFMKVCAWCHRIEHHGRWMPIEKFLTLGSERKTSHGICQECLERARADVAKSSPACAPVAEAVPCPAPQH